MRRGRHQQGRAAVVAVLAGGALLVSMLALPGGAQAMPRRAARAPQCTAAGLDVWLNTAGVGSAGRLTYQLNLTNLSAHTCTLFGYPGVSGINQSGHQLGSAAGRDTYTGTGHDHADERRWRAGPLGRLRREHGHGSPRGDRHGGARKLSPRGGRRAPRLRAGPDEIVDDPVPARCVLQPRSDLSLRGLRTTALSGSVRRAALIGGIGGRRSATGGSGSLLSPGPGAGSRGASHSAHGPGLAGGSVRCARLVEGAADSATRPTPSRRGPHRTAGRSAARRRRRP